MVLYTKKWRLSIGAIGLVLLINSAFAIKPEWVNQEYLLLKAEGGHGQMRTGYTAVVGGVATWLYKYYWEINQFCFGNEDYTYYATLPGYGYTQVTAQKLANAISYDGSLQLYWVPSVVISRIAEALQVDHDLNGPYVTAGYYYDPYYDWKWRSVYMEAQRERTILGLDPLIEANCWGTSSYLTRTCRWSLGSESFIERFCDANSLDPSYCSWPNVYLDGPATRSRQSGITLLPYSFDNELTDYGNYFYLKGFARSDEGVDPRYLINSFDLIRLSDNSAYDVLNYNGVDLGANFHGAAYICTSNDGAHWVFEKSNNHGAAYQLMTFYSYEPYEPSYSNLYRRYRSYWHHDGDMKMNLANSWETNWGGSCYSNPYPQLEF